MKKQVIDFNKILESNIYNLDNVYYDNIKVLNMNKAQLKRVYKKYGFTILLSKNNPKLEKTNKEYKNTSNVGLSIAPHYLNNKKNNIVFNVCNYSNANCRKDCVIWKAGNPAYMKAKRNAMLNRKELLTSNPQLFLACYIRDLQLHTNYCINNKYSLLIRNNVASDISYENIKVIYNNKNTTMINIINSFIELVKDYNIDNVAYDYTKNYNRKQHRHYHKAYSHCDNDINKPLQAIKNGLDLAIIFNVAKNKPLPKYYKLGKLKLMVVDGDKNDYIAEFRNKYPLKPIVRALRIKFNAKDNKLKRLKVIESGLKSGFIKQA